MIVSAIAFPDDLMSPEWRIRVGDDSALEFQPVIVPGKRVLDPDSRDIADEFAAAANTYGAQFLRGVNDKTCAVEGIAIEKLDIVETWVRGICNDSVKPPIMADVRKVSFKDAKGELKAVIYVKMVNAVAHRDYSISGAKIRIHLFSNRLEIISAEGLPNSLPLDELGERQFLRNELNCTCLPRYPLVQQFTDMVRVRIMDRRGEGIPVILSASRKLSRKDALYRLSGDSELRLTIPSIPLYAPDELNAIARSLSTKQYNTVQTKTRDVGLAKIRDLIRANPKFTQSEMARACNVLRTCITNWIKFAAGTICHEGSGNGGI